LMNAFDGFVFDTSLRFHPAVPASNHPALRPTRGSGLGLVVPTITLDPGAAPVEDDMDDLDDAHAAAASAAATTERTGVSLIEWDARDGSREAKYRAVACR
jgi:hypothetical protein